MSNFFYVLGSLIGIEIGTVRNLCFGLLALLLEVSTLGAISLTSSLRAENSEKSRKRESWCEVHVEDDTDLRQRATRLSHDIVNGRIRPVIRQIKASDYGLDFDEIKLVLANLYRSGLIEQDARNSYKLKSINSE